MREITVAAVQTDPQLADVNENLKQMQEFVRQIATEQHVDLILFPELVTTGYECGVRFTELAERVPGPAVNLLTQWAGEFGVYIAAGLAAKEKVESILYNAAVLVGPDGELLGQYNKVHLRGEERLAFRPGFRYTLWETEFGLVGMMLGWDLAFPEVARSLALEGAELILVGANWEEPNADEWKTYLKARAYENSVFIAGANRVGKEYSYRFAGHSLIGGPRGQVFAELEEPVAGYVAARVDLDEVRQVREEYQFFQCRQPTSYRAVVKKY
ncbi:MAG: carbon-nitrogen hydrolase family protein [Chloroflexota bacterium]